MSPSNTLTGLLTNIHFTNKKKAKQVYFNCLYKGLNYKL